MNWLWLKIKQGTWKVIFAFIVVISMVFFLYNIIRPTKDKTLLLEGVQTKVITAIKENYYQTQLSKKDDSKLDRAKLDSKLFKGTNIFDNPITRLAAAGIDLNTLKNPLTGKTIAQEYNAGISQKFTHHHQKKLNFFLNPC